MCHLPLYARPMWQWEDLSGRLETLAMISTMLGGRHSLSRRVRVGLGAGEALALPTRTRRPSSRASTSSGVGVSHRRLRLLQRLYRLRRLRHLSLRQRRRRLSVAMALAAQAIVLRRGGAAGARVLAPVVVGSGANQPRLPHRFPQLRLPQIPLLRRRRRGRAQLWSALHARASARISALTMADSGPTSAGALQCTSTAHAQMVRRECLLVVSARMRSAPPGGAAWRIG